MDAQDAQLFEPYHPIFANTPKSVTFKKTRKSIVRLTKEVIDDFALIPDDARTREKPYKWMVCLSGGKDSYTLMAALLDLKWQGALPVDLLFVNLDQGQPGFPKHILPDYLSSIGVDYRIITEDTYSIVKEKTPAKATYCALCSRLRRGILYNAAREEGCDAIVLGHHRDDALETFMMNMFHGGRLAAMPPTLLNDEGDIKVHRPLLYCAESDIERFSKAMQFPIIPCNLCGTQEGLQRNAMKQMLNEWEQKSPGRRQTMFRSLMNVRPSHLADKSIFDFMDLKPTPPNEDGL
ncbi:tRNA 2-thiocytidine(32) synthetase TtcA [Hirschia litorea]|uniref:tRNA-cytidine(32) 2-sulfurtransferase n=1 Tax=Hirschia litorea TaxID=1199156 RepID=A0ABW2ILR3_9PROT